MSEHSPVAISVEEDPSGDLPDKVTPITAEVVEQILAYITRHAPGWSGNSGEAHVTLHNVNDRAQSTLISVGVEIAGFSQELLIKSPKVVTYDPRHQDRLLKPVSGPLVKSRLEFEALSAIARHFEALDDPRFGWIEVYAHLQNPPATVVERISEPTFDTLLRCPDLAYAGYDTSRVFRNLGAWLAEYHGISMSRVELREANASQVIEGMLKLVDIISKSNTWPRLPSGTAEVIRQAASRVLPAELAMGLGHGDFAPRNVFVGTDCKVTVIDSLARYRAPIYEDLAYLLAELHSGATRLRRRKLPISVSELASMRAALLAGYGIADDAVLKIFELRALLDKWRSLAQRSRSDDLRGRAASVVDTLRRVIVSRRVNFIIQELRSQS